MTFGAGHFSPRADSTIARLLVHATGIDWFHQLNDSVSMVIGAIFVLCVLLFRRGIVGEIRARLLAGAAR